jgi:sulfatase maturation enzyme AslB (radical SAM superfamily)
MECKFLNHGLAVSYNGVLKPCCDWKTDADWDRENNLSVVKDLSNWMTTAPELQLAKEQLANNQWPERCVKCKVVEDKNRFDSTRGYGTSAYADFADDDITLEIRPGNTCNFACQTCWPTASSKVVSFYKKANLDITGVTNSAIDDFDSLLPLAHRIKQVNLLGGEPFYDKSCKSFLLWAKENLTPSVKLSMFTNGSMIDREFVESCPFPLSIVFSIDAVGKKSEYIRHGSEWDVVVDNYNYCRSLDNIDVGVNITVSIFNILYLSELITFIFNDPPATVTIGQAHQPHYKFTLIPHSNRPAIITDLTGVAIDLLKNTKVTEDQKSNVVNAIKSFINELKSADYDTENFIKWKEFVASMDRVKQAAIADYCPELSSMV